MQLVPVGLVVGEIGYERIGIGVGAPVGCEGGVHASRLVHGNRVRHIRRCSAAADGRLARVVGHHGAVQHVAVGAHVDDGARRVAVEQGVVEQALLVFAAAAAAGQIHHWLSGVHDVARDDAVAHGHLRHGDVHRRCGGRCGIGRFVGDDEPVDDGTLAVGTIHGGDALDARRIVHVVGDVAGGHAAALRLHAVDEGRQFAFGVFQFLGSGVDGYGLQECRGLDAAIDIDAVAEGHHPFCVAVALSADKDVRLLRSVAGKDGGGIDGHLQVTVAVCLLPGASRLGAAGLVGIDIDDALSAAGTLECTAVDERVLQAVVEPGIVVVGGFADAVGDHLLVVAHTDGGAACDQLALVGMQVLHQLLILGSTCVFRLWPYEAGVGLVDALVHQLFARLDAEVAVFGVFEVRTKEQVAVGV